MTEKSENEYRALVLNCLEFLIEHIHIEKLTVQDFDHKQGLLKDIDVAMNRCGYFKE